MAARLTAFLVAIIVGISVVAGLIVGAQREAEPAVDVLVYNGRVYTGDPNAPIAEAVAIRGNRILKIGSNREIKRLRRNAATVIDAHGGSILPGFADTYVAVPGQADAIAGIHRLGLTSVGAVVDDLKALDALATLATTADRPLRVAAALKATLPLTEATRRDIDARRSQGATALVRLDALAIDVVLPGPKPAARPTASRRSLPPPLLPNDQQQALLELDRAGWPLVLHVDDERELSVALDVVARLIETNTARRGAAPTPRRAGAPDVARHRAAGDPRPDRGDAAAGNVDRRDRRSRGGPRGRRRRGGVRGRHRGDGDRPGRGCRSGDPAVLVPAARRRPPGDGQRDRRRPAPWPAGAHRRSAGPLNRVGTATPATDAAASPESAPKADSDADDAAPLDRHLVIGALATLTTAAANALGANAEWGTLEPGRLADLVVLSADLFELQASHLLDAVVIATVVDGKVVYDRDTDTPPPTP